ncbi:MAG: hypothetical protein QGH60_02895 [Phycisphaerae bacterium]|jgi:hypothetical protein|nr:hypothetical protein [Phycisphaerae bacterium]
MRKILNFLYNLLPLICGGLFMLLGAVLGGIDAGGPGIGVGGILGLLLGTVASFVVTNLLVLLFGKNATVVPSPDSEGDAYAETIPQRARRYVFRTLAIVALVAVLHESYWFAKMWMATSNYNAGAYMTRVPSHDYPRDRLQDDLEGQRWRHEVLSARPLKWIFAPEALTLNQSNLELIDIVTEKAFDKPPAPLEDIPAVTELTALWRYDYTLGHAVSDRSLNIYGTALCKLTAEQLGGHQSRGWVLRYLPSAWFR